MASRFHVLPVDHPGVSTWTPFVDVTVNDGCLEVIDKSHMKGCESPVDFMVKSEIVSLKVL